MKAGEGSWFVQSQLYIGKAGLFVLVFPNPTVSWVFFSPLHGKARK